MPCTFSHPLAVLPLRRWCPKGLNFAALIIGSMSPDFAYFTRQFSIAHFAHTIPGTFAVCLPTGLLALAVFYALRQSLCFILPQPHRAALTPLAAGKLSVSVRSVLVAAVSILLGAWSHTIWDSFTHDGAWAVRHLALLRAPLIHIGTSTLPASYLLQQASTFGAGLALVILYGLWLRLQPAAPPATDQFSRDAWRYLLLAALAVIALSAGVPAARRMAAHYDGFMAIRVFIFRTTVYSAAVFTPLFALSACLLHAIQRKRVRNQ